MKVYQNVQGKTALASQILLCKLDEFLMVLLEVSNGALGLDGAKRARENVLVAYHGDINVSIYHSEILMLATYK